MSVVMSVVMSIVMSVVMSIVMSIVIIIKCWCKLHSCNSTYIGQCCQFSFFANWSIAECL